MNTGIIYRFAEKKRRLTKFEDAYGKQTLSKTI